MLVIHDALDGAQARQLLRVLRGLNTEALLEASPAGGLEAARRILIDLAVLGERAFRETRGEVARRLREIDPDVPVVVLSSEDVDGQRAGLPEVYDWLAPGRERVEPGLRRALEHRMLTWRVRTFEQEAGGPLEWTLGTGTEASEAVCAIDRAAATGYCLILHIEDGMGAEDAARRVHARSVRAADAFVEWETEESGGPVHPGSSLRGGRNGRGERSIALGTLFLRGLERYGLREQSRVLRALREGVEGGAEPRLIASTSIAPEELLVSGRLQAELFRRLNEMVIRVRALRERPDDLARLARYYLSEAGSDLGRPLLGFTEEGLEALLAYPWPGNALELRNVIRRAAAAADPLVGRGHLGPLQVHGQVAGRGRSALPSRKGIA
ncbi:MAG: hypothetical protein HYZ53_23970 [Planctomycetes bacterium]|nr:hypothetical protein [Planctomycetota bacterium]